MAEIRPEFNEAILKVDECLKSMLKDKSIDSAAITAAFLRRAAYIHILHAHSIKGFKLVATMSYNEQIKDLLNQYSGSTFEQAKTEELNRISKIMKG